MKTTTLAAAVLIAVIGVCAAVYALEPLTVYSLSLLVSFTDDYELVLTPDFFITQVPRMNLMSTQGVVIRERYDLFGLGINSFFCQLNATAVNADGITFFNGSFTINTLAEQKVTFIREYNASDYTNALTLTIAAHLLVDFENSTDIERFYNNTWSMVLP